MKMSSIMAGIMVKNSARWLPAFFKAVEGLDYPEDKLRLVFEYGISNDTTLDMLKEYKKKSKFKVEVYQEPTDDDALKVGGAQCAAIIYKDFQKLIEEDCFLLLDSDLIELPKNLIQELLKVQADIVAPYPWSENKRHFYDSWIWRIRNIRFSPQKPPGDKLSYPIRVGSVGCCFICPKDIWVNLDIKNPYPNLTLCNDATAKGYLVAGVPYLEVIHVDLEELGIIHMPLKPKFGGYPSSEGFLDSSYIVEPVPLRE